MWHFFVILYQVVLALKSVDKTLVRGRSNKTIEHYLNVVLENMLCKRILTFTSV